MDSPGARQHQGRTRQHGAQINLQAAVAADVVESAPHRMRGGWSLRRQRAAQAAQRVHDQLRRSGGSRGQQNPLRAFARRRRGPCTDAARPGRAAADTDIAAVSAAGANSGSASTTMASACGRAATPASCCGGKIGRAQHHAPRHAVEFDQRERRRQLLAALPAAPSGREAIRAPSRKWIRRPIRPRAYPCAAPVKFAAYRRRPPVQWNCQRLLTSCIILARLTQILFQRGNCASRIRQ